MPIVRKMSELGIPSYLNEFFKRYFQVEVLGGENIPKIKDQNYMIVMNHTAFFGLEVYLLNAFLMSRDPDVHVKTLVWKGFTDGPMGFWFKTLGCKAATIQTGGDLLKAGESVLILPEGVGATDVRNRFNKFHTGFLRIVKESPVPIIPVGFYGVDESIPWYVTHNPWLVEKFMKPVDPNFDFLILPKLPILRPTKIVFNVGKPLLLTKKALESEKKIQKKTGEIQEKIESLVDHAEDHRTRRIKESSLNARFHGLFEGKISFLD